MEMEKTADATLWLSSRATIAVGERVLSASGELDEVVEGGACTFEQGVSGSRVDARMGVVCERLQRWAAACMALFPWFPSLAAGFVVVLRLCDSSERGAQVSTDLRHQPIRVV
eukprot:scaffold5968_cov126-Isochrysis_galbana.AAC.1